ncbi:hypothetical protein F2Q70_00020632 [Brassica cretica]|uniref:Uncharacterized protein n=1 Tax=Brassica cretica TaxID=69181 RepID=A0A8S9GLV7_BRACR|nr:hypothetical protein F2Q70_00020632 [Brassica cretica]
MSRSCGGEISKPIPVPASAWKNDDDESEKWRSSTACVGESSSNDVKPPPGFSGVSIVSCRKCRRRDEAIQDLLLRGTAQHRRI